jgi:hypothetical protein
MIPRVSRFENGQANRSTIYMSQLPPPPPGVEPGDFAPIGIPHPHQQAYPQPPARTNGWAIASLISGLLGCVPYVAGIAAVIMGIVGLKRSRDPRYASGRGMAIGGLVLGGLSVVFWLFFSSVFIGMFTATGQPRQLAQDFVKLTSDGAVDAAMAHAAPMLTRGQVEQLATGMQEWGAYQDVTSYSSSIQVAGGITTCELSGTATFANGEHPFRMTLVKEQDAWKVSGVEIE